MSETIPERLTRARDLIEEAASVLEDHIADMCGDDIPATDAPSSRASDLAPSRVAPDGGITGASSLIGAWDRMRALIEAGQRDAARCGWCGEQTEHPCYAMATALDCEPWKRAAAIAKAHAASIDTKQAQHDGSRQIYGDAGKFMRGGEPG